MQYTPTIILSIALALLSNANAAIQSGDVVGINFHSATNAPVKDWNNFSTKGRIADGSVVGLGGEVLRGLTMTLTPGIGGFTDDSYAEGWSGALKDAYYSDSESLNDIQHGDGMKMTITGLNPNLEYKVIIYSVISNVSYVTDGFSINGGTVVSSTRGDRWSSLSPVVLQASLPDGGSTLVIEADVSRTANTFWNAVVVEAISPKS